MAAWLIILAAIFDTLDGLMARLTKTSSEFGVELDSLSDLVSFGVAPSFLIYRLGLHALGPIGTLSSAMVMVFGGMGQIEVLQRCSKNLRSRHEK